MIATWKKWLSYVIPITIDRASSEHNPDLQVVLDKGRLQLLSGNAIYSWDDLYRNFKVAFEQIEIQKSSYENMLMLGLGLGSIPFILEKIFNLNLEFTAVEHDEAVSELAARHTLNRLKSKVDVITADATVFVELCEDRFDLVVIDIFQDDLVPTEFESIEFLQKCKSLLNPGGMLLFNRLYNHNSNQKATERFFQDVFKKAFPEAKAYDTRGNWVLAGRNE